MSVRSLLTALFLLTLVASKPVAGLADAPASDAALQARLPDGVLRWGGDAEGGAPFQLRSPDDPSKIIGFEVEIADALAEALSKRIGRKVTAEFVQYDWTSLTAGLLAQNDFDMILSGFEVTPENAAAVRFTRPYYIFAQQLVVRRAEQAITCLEDCLGRPIGTLSGSAAERLLTARGARRIVGFDGQIEPYLDLKRGRLDAVLLDSPIAIYYASSEPELKLLGPPIEPGAYAIGLRPDDRVLAEAIDAALCEIMCSGRLQQILRKWHLWNGDQAKLAAGEKRDTELFGLGFDGDGQPLATAVVDDATVSLDIANSSAQSWTFARYAPELVRAAGMTVFLTVASMALAMALGLLVCVSRLYGPAPLRWLALAYIEFFRGVPLLLVLFFFYFGLPTIGIQMTAIETAILGFGLSYAAYEAEIYRSSINGVPRNQWDAALALGMPERLAFRRVILPQAWRTALGPITNDFVALFKDTSLVSVIAVRELTKEYLILSRSSYKFVEMGLLTAFLYLAMSVPLGYLSRYLEQRGGPGQGSAR